MGVKAGVRISNSVSAFLPSVKLNWKNASPLLPVSCRKIGRIKSQSGLVGVLADGSEVALGTDGYKALLMSLPRPNWKNPIHLAAFGFGSGAPRRAPGTWGTAAAIIPYLWLRELPLSAYLAVIVLAFVVGVYLCGRTSRDLKVHDHGGIVWDEFVGLWITLILVRTGLGLAAAGLCAVPSVRYRQTLADPLG